MPPSVMGRHVGPPFKGDGAAQQRVEADEAEHNGASQLIWKDLVSSLVRGLLFVCR